MHSDFQNYLTEAIDRVLSAALAEICGAKYHLLREFALDHAEAGSIMQAID